GLPDRELQPGREPGFVDHSASISETPVDLVHNAGREWPANFSQRHASLRVSGVSDALFRDVAESEVMGRYLRAGDYPADRRHRPCRLLQVHEVRSEGGD